MTALKKALTSQALELGFSDCRICSPDAIPLAPDRLATFLDTGYHATMGWLKDRAEWRGNPVALWPEAQSVIMLTDNYGPSEDPLKALEKRSNAAISVYAQNKDYHDVVKKRLKSLGRWLIAQQPGTEIKVFVDTAPVMEKPLAQAAGLGWQGKHTNLVSRDQGSWVFLGAIFATVELPPDEPETDHCGNCRKCLDICPTNAFPSPYQLDARLCISYLTIEHAGPIDPALRPQLGNRIYGCDDCLAICPWNKFAVQAQQSAYIAREELKSPSLNYLAELDDPAFRELFSKSPVKRIGRNRFVRNVLYAIGNSGDINLLDAAKQNLTDEDPVVRDAAEWAVAALTGKEMTQ